MNKFLKRQVAIPQAIENQLPQGVPKISSVLASIAETLPGMPNVPATTTHSSKAFPFREFISSMEEKMPASLPKFTVTKTQQPTGQISQSRIVGPPKPDVLGKPRVEVVETSKPKVDLQSGYNIYGSARGMVDLSDDLTN